MCRTVCVIHDLRELFISVLGVRLRKTEKFCVRQPPFRFRWTEQTSRSVAVHLGLQPPKWTKPYVQLSFSAFYVRCICPAFPPLNGMIFLSAHRFCTVPNHLQIDLSAFQVFPQQTDSGWRSQYVCSWNVLCCFRLEDVWWNLNLLRTRIVQERNYVYRLLHIKIYLNFNWIRTGLAMTMSVIPSHQQR